MEEIERIADILRKGGVMLYPTDTLWGLGCDATNKEAVAKIAEIKKRSESKSFIVLVDGEDMLYRYVQTVPDVARDIVELSDSPITIIYPKGMGFADGVCGEDDSVAIRVVNHDFCKKIIRKLKRPIVSTSANISGEGAATKLSEVSQELKNMVDVVVPKSFEGNPTRKPSSIIKLSVDGQVKVIR